MRSISIIFLLFLFSTLSVCAQTNPTDNTETNQPSKYLLTAYISSGEVITTTGRIVRTIALCHPKSMEIARIYVNYNVNIKLKTDPIGETVAVVSFKALKLTGDLDYKGFDISDQIFPSLVSFRLLSPGSATDVLATVKAANVNNGECSVTVSLHKNVTETPIIDQLAFYHSDEDFEKADSQMKLIDRYYTAGWLVQRTGRLLDALQSTQLHDPSAYLASNLEVIIISDWLTRQHFNRYPLFQKKDTLSLIKTIEVSCFRKKLIDQDFIKSNVISNEDLLKASKLFADNFAYYFDSSQPDFNRDTYLAQMAESRLSSVGYNAIRDFADSYMAVHKQPKSAGRLFEKASALIRSAMTEKAFQLADKEQFSEAMSMLNASDKYNLQYGAHRSLADSMLIGKLTQRLYSAYLDFALKSLNTGIYSITTDYYQKAIQLKQTYDGLILPDTRERYLADMICKSLLSSAEKSLKSNDTQTALADFEKAIRMAETARLKEDYETARIRLEAISNRPSGYKPWVGDDLVIVIPVAELEKIKASARIATEMNKDSIPTVVSRRQKAKVIASIKAQKTHLSRKQLKALKDSVSLSSKIVPGKKLKRSKRQPVQADSLQQGAASKVVIVKVNAIRQQILDNIETIHLKIWTGDTISSALMLNKTDSLQQLLSLSGDKSLESDIRALKINLEDKRCEQQKSAYLQELDHVRNQIVSKDFNLAASQLQLLIAKSFPASCPVDKSEAIRLLSTLESPLVYKRWVIQLDSITRTQEPWAIIEAFEKANEYYRLNMIDKLGVVPPDLMAALKTRKETSFLLKAVTEMLDSHRPAYALELMKEIHKLEPKPDMTLSLQKRLGEMLASGDHADSKTANDMLNTYNINEKWYSELITAYKKRWKLFSK